MRVDEEKKEEESEESMEYRNQRELNDYMNQYSPMYMPDIPSTYVGNNPYMPESRSQAILINPKQIYWIRKRKIRRELLDSVMIQQNNNYMHESRHRHAMKRVRAPSGRFLTKEETAEFRKQEKLDYKNGSSSSL